tara:strand:- start:440 stop:1147 length:708 start_codon:yes stop_codon:yes gene_type:complete
MTNLLIFDWDDTLFPALISDIIIKETSINENNITFITIIIYNLLIIMNKLKNNINNKLVILTASRNNWVEISIINAEKLIYTNRHLINYNLFNKLIIKPQTESPYIPELNHILTQKNFISNFLLDIFNKNIYYVNILEKELLNSYETFNKYNSLFYLLLINKINNVIILGDSIENERYHTIKLIERFSHKIIKFIKFNNSKNHIDKIHEQYSFFIHLNNIINFDKSYIFDSFYIN